MSTKRERCSHPKPGQRFLPDVNRSFQQFGWELADEIIPIHKSNPLFEISDAEREIAEEKSRLMSLFWQAILDSEHQQYNRAAEKFRKVLKEHNLLEFDHLAVLNGLANALVAHNPEDNKLLNGWITTLIKNKEIEKAQELLGQKKAS